MVHECIGRDRAEHVVPVEPGRNDAGTEWPNDGNAADPEHRFFGIG